MIEDKRSGMLALLDEQCIMPNGNDNGFCTKLQSEIPNSQYLYSKKMKGTLFTIKHYAAEVTYDALGFCFKNKDPVQPSIVDIMSASTSGYVRDMFNGHRARMADREANSANRANLRPGSSFKTSGSTLIFESVTAQFKRQLADLMTRINSAHPHFVRCINPNSKKEADKFEPEMVLDQLRCSGLMEAVRVSRAGFPVRMPHSDFIQRFTILISPPPGAPKDVAKQMCVSLRVPSEHYRLGKTKVFMRREIIDKLEEERSRLLVNQARTIQKTVRGHLARNLVRRLRVQRKEAATRVQCSLRRQLVRRWYSDMLEKRSRMSNQGGMSNIKDSMPESILKRQASKAQRSAAPPGPPAPGISRGPPGPPISGGGDPKIVEELNMQLDSVRELYYNERASQMALSNLVREVQELREPEAIRRRIKALQDKIKAQRQQEAAAQRPNMASDYEDGALGRRTDSLQAALGLLEDKLSLILAAASAPRVDMNRIRADVEREMGAKFEGDFAARLRTLGDAIRLESRETIRHKDAEIEALQLHVGGLRAMLDDQQQQHGDANSMHEQHLVERLRVRDAEVESLEQIKSKMMADRAVLEQIIRNERKQREVYVCTCLSLSFREVYVCRCLSLSSPPPLSLYVLCMYYIRMYICMYIYTYIRAYIYILRPD